MRKHSDTLIVFTHIPKTSGISLIKELAEPNIGLDRIARTGSFRKLIKYSQQDVYFLSGHFPYGIHLFTLKKAKYITFLRDPIDRAVSFYYFVQQDGDNPKTRHPLCDYAESVSLKEFYLNNRFHNLQTRFTAGLFFHKFYPLLESSKLENWILKRAMSNLSNKYFCFGLLEKREASLLKFSKKFNWNSEIEISPQKKTRKRSRVSQLDNETIGVLRFANRLDQKLYDFALSIFDLENQSNQNSFEPLIGK